jgi:transglutaminase-like putative cysteine protease
MMRYQITHVTQYNYEKPVCLSPHTIRLRPRSDIHQQLIDFDMKINHQPRQINRSIDLDGNNLYKLWFNKNPIDELIITTKSKVECNLTNPFDFLLETYGVEIPMDYPHSLWLNLQPYLQGYFNPNYIDPVAYQLGQDIHHLTGGNTINFLTTLNKTINESCEYTHRETGAPLSARVTWENKRGSCRDFTLLYMEVCRAVGLASRFVSGYQFGDPEQQQHLHAWAEVYLPGAGWRGYDPTLGVAVSDRHIPLVSSVTPQATIPVTGSLEPGYNCRQTLNYQISIAEI